MRIDREITPEQMSVGWEELPEVPEQIQRGIARSANMPPSELTLTMDGIVERFWESDGDCICRRFPYRVGGRPNKTLAKAVCHRFEASIRRVNVPVSAHYNDDSVYLVKRR